MKLTDPISVMVQTDKESLFHVKLCQFISGDNLAKRKSSQFFPVASLNDQNQGWENAVLLV